MIRLQFPLTSEQLELLLAFEDSQGLTELATKMAKDPSVVSRGLQRLAETCPVIEKINNRWQVTGLGKEVIVRAKAFATDLNQLLSVENSSKLNAAFDTDQTMLLVINAQKSLLLPGIKKRNNLSAEANIEKILNKWRKLNRPVAHIKHVSDNPQSTFYKGAPTSDFIVELQPQTSELVIEKKKASSFYETNLNEIIQNKNITNLVLVGFTGNDCIDATTRDASTLGFNPFVVTDATATFDLTDPSGKNQSGDRIHSLVLANISALYGQLIDTMQLLRNENF